MVVSCLSAFYDEMAVYAPAELRTLFAFWALWAHPRGMVPIFDCQLTRHVFLGFFLLPGKFWCKCGLTDTFGCEQPVIQAEGLAECANLHARARPGASDFWTTDKDSSPLNPKPGMHQGTHGHFSVVSPHSLAGLCKLE